MSFLQRLLAAWAVDALSLALAAWIFSGVWGSVGSVVVAALVFGLLRAFLKPLLKLVTFPLAIVTLGLAWFLVSMFILWLTSALVGGFHIDGFWTLVGATIVVWAVGSLGDHFLFPRKRDQDRGARFARA